MKLIMKLFILIAIPFLIVEMVSAKTLNIAFINGRTNTGFWKTVEDFMLEVAEDFNDVKLTIYRAESDQINQIKILNNITSQNSKIKYDAVLTRTLKKNGIQLLNIAEKNKTPLFLFNSGLTVDQIARFGGPRKKYKYFIGEMYPDDEAAGYDSAKELFTIAQKNKLIGRRDGNRMGLLALAGGVANNASTDRTRGMKKFIDENEKQLVLLQTLNIYDHNEGGFKDFEKKMHILQKRYNRVSLVWSYNDTLSIEVLNAFLESNPFDLIPGKSFFSGGIDWTPEAIKLIDSGKMAYSLGGHYMDGGWAFVVVYDYLNGKDFKDTEGISSFFSKLSVINKGNVAAYKKLFKERMVRKVDFTRFSKLRNSSLKKYNFGLNQLIDQLQM